MQFPEGLKQHALAYAKKLEAAGDEVVISASPTFGACDLAVEEAKRVGAAKLIHFGHSEFHHVDFNVEYVPYEITLGLDLLPVSLEKLRPYNTICLLTTVQHAHQLDEIKKFYEARGKGVAYNRPNGLAKQPGQLLGCDVGNVASLDRSVDAFVYFGGGLFHPVGALLQTTKPFFVIDPFIGKVEEISHMRKEHERKRRGRIASALYAKRFGILVSTKNGQYNMGLARILKSRLEEAGLEAAVLVSNTFDFSSLGNMLEFDAFVNTACPRLITDDYERLSKPLLSANEAVDVVSMLGERRVAARAASEE